MRKNSRPPAVKFAPANRSQHCVNRAIEKVLARDLLHLLRDRNVKTEIWDGGKSLRAHGGTRPPGALAMISVEAAVSAAIQEFAGGTPATTVIVFGEADPPKGGGMGRV